MTADLAEVALAFCREVMGIKKAAHDKSLKAITVRDKAAGIGYRVVLYYTDLNAVMEAVRKWLEDGEREDWGLVVRLTRRGKYVAVVQNEAYGPPEEIGESEELTDCCQAIMSACAEAARKVKS